MEDERTVSREWKAGMSLNYAVLVRTLLTDLLFGIFRLTYVTVYYTYVNNVKEKRLIANGSATILVAY